ncbi:MAG: hypothetical protein IJF70_02120 [Opitutales bacterium]|nr:hypothetical protein [Opitutales bacterium]
MKKLILILSSLLIVASAYSFSFSNLAKKVADTASTIAENDTTKALSAKQENALAKYKQSKEEFLKGFSIIADALGATDLKKQADDALAKVEAQTVKTLDVETITQVADEVVAKAKADTTASDVAKSASDVVKAKYEEAMSYFKKAIEGEVETAKVVADVATQARDAMKNAETSGEKIKIASTLKPSMELAKTIPDDISKSKEAVLAMLQKIKANGATLSSDLLDSLKK